MNWAERKTFGKNRPVRFLHVSVEIVHIPLLAPVNLDPFRGLALQGDGWTGRTKGVTYRRYPAGQDRREHRRKPTL